jgi:hypothetical protein
MSYRKHLLVGGCALALLPLPFMAHHHHHPFGPPGPPPGPPHGHGRASITQLSASSLMSLSQPEGWQKQVQVEPFTFVHRGPERLDSRSLQVGQQVHVRDHVAENGLRVADDVDILPGFESFGRVVTVGPGLLEVQSYDGQLYVAQTSADCRTHCRGWSVDLNQVQPGELVRVEGDGPGIDGSVAAHDLDFPEQYGFWHFLLWPAGLSLAGLGAAGAMRKKKL